MSKSSDLSTNVTPELPFECIKQIDPDGIEFWSARDLMVVLEYSGWQRFKNVILKAQISCENSGQDAEYHFNRAVKMVIIGSDAKRESEDLHLSRYACYLVVQNSDPAKEVVALGQTYFAVQTRRQEVADETTHAEVTEGSRRLVLRRKVADQNTDLASAAKNAGVITTQDFGVFQNHGYKGLYNGLTADGIRKKKKLKTSQNILDHMSTSELAANLFRSTQAEDKLRMNNINGKDEANQVHFDAGIMVRNAIKDFGGTMPENMPTVESVKKLERQQRKNLPAPKADDTDAQ